MMKHGSKQGLDQSKGTRPERRQKIIDSIKSAQKAKNTEGRVGKGRFNAAFAMEKQARLEGTQGGKDNR